MNELFAISSGRQYKQIREFVKTCTKIGEKKEYTHKNNELKQTERKEKNNEMEKYAKKKNEYVCGRQNGEVKTTSR